MDLDLLLQNALRDYSVNSATLGQGSDLPPVNSPEMEKFTSQFNQQNFDLKTLNSGNQQTYNPVGNMKYDPEQKLQTYNPNPNYDPEKSLKQESQRIDNVLTTPQNKN